MRTLHSAPTKSNALLIKSLSRLERRGRYDEALLHVEHLWKDFRERPIVDDLEPRDAAEIVLRCGSLIGYHGHIEQIKDSQIISRDLLTDAICRFSDIDDWEKVAECENYLALSYWRTGEHNEALACIESSLARDISPTADARFFGYIVATLVNLGLKRYAENIEYGKALENEFREHGSDFMMGCLCSNIGISYKNLNNLPEALTYIELAKYHHSISRNSVYMGTAENNLAQLYRLMGRFSLAHAAIDNAGRIFKRLKDKTREGFLLDTKALIYFAEKQYPHALQTVDKALAILLKSENVAYQVETMMTRVKVLLYLDRFSDAIFGLVEAVGIAKQRIDEKTARRLVSEFEAMLSEMKTPTQPDLALAEGDLELVLPQSIAHFNEYRGVWINNTGLDRIGLAKGSLAIVVDTDVKRGDLVAISEVESGAVSCGFYDADFGMVCLEGVTGEPRIFDDKDIRVLGKIVGVSTTGKDKDGKMVVQPLNI